MISLQLCSGFVFALSTAEKMLLLQESIREDLSLEQRPHQGLSTGQIDQRQFYFGDEAESILLKRVNNRAF